MTDFEHSGRATSNWLLCDCEECECDREALFAHIKAWGQPCPGKRDGNRDRGGSAPPTFIRNLISRARFVGSKFGRGPREIRWDPNGAARPATKS